MKKAITTEEFRARCLEFPRNPLPLEPVTPDSNLALYSVALDRDHIRDVYIPLAEKYWADPERYAVPENQPASSFDWGMHNIRVMFVCATRKVCSEQVRMLVGDGLNENRRFLKYVAAQRLGVTCPGLDQVSSLTELYEVWTDMLWESMSKRFVNPALAICMQDAGGLVPASERVHGLLLTVPGGNAVEGAYGYGLNLAGIYDQIGPADPMSIWVPNKERTTGDRGYRYELSRAEVVDEAISEAKTIVSLGAGWMPEIRHAERVLGERPNWTGKTLYGCDQDPKIPTELFGEWTAASGLKINYRQLSIANALPQLINILNRQVDLVYAKGVISFMPQKLAELLPPVLMLLKSGGQFIFDLQLNHDILKRDILLFSWGGMLTEGKLHLMEVDEAMSFVERVIRQVNTKMGLPLNFKCETDDRNDPMGLVVTVTKA